MTVKEKRHCSRFAVSLMRVSNAVKAIGGVRVDGHTARFGKEKGPVPNRHI